MSILLTDRRRTHTVILVHTLRVVQYQRLMLRKKNEPIRNSYTMGCPPVRGDNPRALASGLSYVQVDKHGITILYHLHQCRPCTSRDNSW